MSFSTNVQVIYKQIPVGFPSPTETFEIKKSTIVPKDVVLNTNDILIRVLYASVDPYMRARMRDVSIKSYFPALVPGKPMQGGIIGEVVKSADPAYVEGDVVLTFGNWEQYTVINSSTALSGVKKIPNAKNSPVPVSYYLGVLGMPGLTAYIGLHKICEPLTPGQTLYVSAASGAVGQVVGQYGKALGLRVVGSAGDDAKVDYLLKDLGFDAAFNYKKHDDLTAILKETCPNGIDIYFENVGGKMLDAVLVNANANARVAVCGMISQYNLTNPEPIYNIANVIWKKIRFEGFIVSDDVPKYGSACIKAFSKLVQEGKLKYRETVTEGIEKAPHAFVDMLQGKNFGKAIVRIGDL